MRSQRAFCVSRLVELEGQFEGTAAEAPKPAEPLVVFAGRHIPEKNPVVVVHAVAKARETIPELCGVYGNGPEQPKVLAAMSKHGLEGTGETIRGSTLAWFTENARRLSLAASLNLLDDTYADG